MAETFEIQFTTHSWHQHGKMQQEWKSKKNPPCIVLYIFYFTFSILNFVICILYIYFASFVFCILARGNLWFCFLLVVIAEAREA